MSKIQRAPIKLDKVDLELLPHLQQDGRRSLTELGEKLGVSHGTVRNRFQKLVTHGIAKVVAIVDPKVVGFPVQVLIGINADLRHMESIEKQLAGFEETTFVLTLTGRLDFIVGAVFSSPGELRRFLVKKLSRVEGIRRTETFHVLDFGKRIWHWHVGVQAGR